MRRVKCGDGVTAEKFIMMGNNINFAKKKKKKRYFSQSRYGD